MKKKKKFLTCESCGKTSSDVRRLVCAYDIDVNDIDPDDESYMEDVCEDCETEHSYDI